jgi:hypothetical protein
MKYPGNPIETENKTLVARSLKEGRKENDC